MTRGGAIRAAMLAASLPLLSGCVALALVPVAASSSAIVKRQMDAKREQRVSAPAPATPAPTPTPIAQAPLVVPAVPAAAPVRAATVPPEMQYLYGSGESAAASIQAYQALTAYLAAHAADRRKGTAQRQVVLSDGATLDQPQFDPCGPKPLAVVLDIDETALLNLGYEGDAAARGAGYDDPRWQRWEASGADKVAAVPGARAALDAARRAGVTVIFNSNRTAAAAAATEAALAHAGLGPAKHGVTLWLKGDDGGGSGKDDRRWAIASGYCVIALVGDQLGDFSDLFNAPALRPSTRRAMASLPALQSLWGNGWFMLPNPVYGSALKGGMDDVFPAATRWTDPGPTPASAQPGGAPAQTGAQSQERPPE